jgi:hypothetical protein
MAWYGPVEPGPNWRTLAENTMVAREFSVPETEGLAKVQAYLDGGGGESGSQSVRPAFYDAEHHMLMAVGDPITVTAGDPPRWLDLRLSIEYIGQPIMGEHFRVALHSGRTSGVARVATEPGPGQLWTDSYADGPDEMCPASPTAIQLPSSALLTSAVWDPTKPEADDLHYSRYAHATAQAVFRKSTPDHTTQRFATCEWYGGRLSEEQGSNALVRSEGPLAELVGERLMVTNPATGANVAVYCHAENSQVVTDLSLSRRAFMEVAYLSTEQLDVIVEVLV